MRGRTVLASCLVAAVLTAPATASARLYCRWTGQEVAPANCHDRVTDEAPILTSGGCCDRRVQTPLPTAKVETQGAKSKLVAAVVVELAWFEPSLAPPPIPVDAAPPRPPPLSATRILLI